jgi:hypothetical protein
MWRGGETGLLDATGLRSCVQELINLAASEATQQDLIQAIKFPAVHELVTRLCGEPVPLYGHVDVAETVQYRLDRLPQLLPRANVSRTRPKDRHRLHYDRNEVVLVPGTHKGELPPPTSLRRMDELDATLRPTVGAHPGLLRALSVSPSKSSLYGAFVWTHMALNRQKWWLLARAAAQRGRASTRQ